MPKDKQTKATKATKVAAPVSADLEQARKDLFAKAKKAGSIDQRDITAAIADTPENADVLDKLYTALADNSIQVVSLVAGTEEEPAEMSDEWVVEDGEEVVVEDQHYLDDIADDSVRLYLASIAPEESEGNFEMAAFEQNSKSAARLGGK